MTIYIDSYSEFLVYFDRSANGTKLQHHNWYEKIRAFAQWLLSGPEYLRGTGYRIRAYIDKPESTDIRFCFEKAGVDHFISMKIQKCWLEFFPAWRNGRPTQLRETRPGGWLYLTLGKSQEVELDQLKEWGNAVIAARIRDRGYAMPTSRKTTTAAVDPTPSLSAKTQEREIELEQERYEADQAGAFDASSIEDARKRIKTHIVYRQGQPAFRRDLFEAYDGRCAISGCDVSEALEAAHIVPYQGRETNHVQNGLLLRADLHTLFDLRLLEIDPETLAVRLDPRLHDSAYAELNGKKLRLPDDRAKWPSVEALKKKRQGDT